MENSIQSLITEELNKKKQTSSSIQNLEIFSPEYIPREILFREREILELTKYFSGLFNSPVGRNFFRQSVIISGPAGVGKTATIKRFGIDLEEIAKGKINHFNLKFIYLNCRKFRTVYLLIVQILQTLIPDFPKRGLSNSELIRELLEYIEHNNMYFIIAFDEIEYLIKESEVNNLLYTFTRINDENTLSTNQLVSLIIISRDKKFLESIDSSTNSSLSKNLIKFSLYSRKQIKIILKNRFNEIFLIKKLSEVDLDSVIDCTIKYNHDLRIALEILRSVYITADNSNHSTTTKEIISEVVKNYFPLNIERLKDLPLPEKITLLSVCKLFAEKKTASKITLIMAKRQYHIESNRYNLSIGQGHTSFWSYIKKLNELELIETHVINQGTKGRSTEIQLKIPPRKLVYELQTLIDIHIQEKRKEFLKKKKKTGRRMYF